MKGQTLIFEQVILFGISVAIFLILFSVFTIYQNYYLEVGGSNQLDESKEWISANILKVAEKENATTISIIPIPRNVADAVYSIALSNNEKLLILENLLTKEKKTSSLYDIGKKYTLSGNLTSMKGKITIKKEGKLISIV